MRAAVLLWLWGILIAAAPAPGLAPAGEGVGARVLSGHELALADGRTVRLAGIRAPLVQSSAEDAVADGYARTAKSLLEELALGRPLALYLARAAPDRYGRLLAHPVGADGVWFQRALLEAGLARVFTTADTAAGAPALYRAEDLARAARRGLWRHWRFAVQPADRVRSPAGRFAIVRGTVADAAKVGGTLYINFGDDWREDFTIRIEWEGRRRFDKARRGEEGWAGRLLEVRGAVEYFNGPMITVTHPAQIRTFEP